jgi:hypothetical protein
MAATVQAELHEKLRNSIEGHPWCAEMFLAGRNPTFPVSPTEYIDGLVALAGGMIEVVDLLAVEIDSLKAHTRPPTD